MARRSPISSTKARKRVEEVVFERSIESLCCTSGWAKTVVFMRVSTHSQ
jgi:hypothetical protein